jgi:UDP-N-acetylmuramate--alanine ligase
LVFQPHLYTRTRDLASDFGAALSLADDAYLLPIYPAREWPIEGVCSEMIRSHTHPEGFTVWSKEIFADWVAKQWCQHVTQPKVLVTAGAGDIDQLYPVILNRLPKK